MLAWETDNINFKYYNRYVNKMTDSKQKVVSNN